MSQHAPSPSRVGLEQDARHLFAISVKWASPRPSWHSLTAEQQDGFRRRVRNLQPLLESVRVRHDYSVRSQSAAVKSVHRTAALER